MILIVLILWHSFWSEGERTRAIVFQEGVQEIEVQVKGGYTPDLIVVEAGRPVRLDFHRSETASCSEEVVSKISASEICSPLSRPPQSSSPRKSLGSTSSPVAWGRCAESFSWSPAHTEEHDERRRVPARTRARPAGVGRTHLLGLSVAIVAFLADFVRKLCQVPLFQGMPTGRQLT